MRLFWTICACALLIMPLADRAAAAVVVTVTGQAVDTGVGGKDQTRRRALEDALYQAALMGGASVDGITVVDNAVLSVNQTRIMPKAQVLDYAVVQETREDGFFRLTIKAVVGDAPKPAICERRSQLHVVQYAPQLQLDPRLPAKLGATLDALQAAYYDGMSALSYVQTTQMQKAQRPAQYKPRIQAAFDYTSLTRGTPQQISPDTDEEFTITAAIALRQGPRPNAIKPMRQLTLDFTAFIASPQKYGQPQRVHLSKNFKYAFVTGSNTLDTLAKPDWQKLTRVLQAEIMSAMADRFDAISCAPLKVKLTLQDGALQIPFGAENGIQAGWLAYVQAPNGRYTVLELTKLAQNTAQLRPLNPQSGLSELDGKHITFMELDG